MSESNLTITVEALDRASRPLQAIGKAIDNIEKNVKGIALMDLGQNFKEKLTDPIANGLSAVANSALAFGGEMAQVNKAFGVAIGSQGAATLNKQVLDLSSALGAMPQEVAAIAGETGRLGVAQKQFQDYVTLVTKGGVAFDMTAEQAGDSFAKLTNVMGFFNAQTGAVDMAGLEQLGDAINYFADNGATAEAAIADVLIRSGGATRQFGLMNTEATALAASVLNLGVDASTAGTVVSTILPMLQNASQGTNKFKGALDQIGLPAEKFQKLIAQDASGAIVTFLDAVKQSGDTSIISRMFGTGSDAAILTSMVENLDAVKSTFDAIDGIQSGSMMATFDDLGQTPGAAIDQVKADLSVLAITIGGAITPAIKSVMTSIAPLIQGFAKFAQANPGIVKVGIAIAAVAAVLGPVLIYTGMVVSAIGTLMPIITGIGIALAAVATGPILIGIAALAAAAVALIASWSPARQVFMTIANAVLRLGATLLMMAANAVLAIGKFVLAFVTGRTRVVATIVQMGAQILSKLASIAGQALAAGRKIVQNIAQGILSGIGAVANAGKAVANAVMSVLPNSPVPTGPLTALNNIAHNPGAKIVDMLSAGMRSQAGALGSTLGSALSLATSPAALVAGSNTSQSPTAIGGGGNTFTINLTVSEGMAQQGIEALEQQIDELMARYGARQERLSFG